ncbi:related to sexual differentiation process protein isp4 [Rhynchosporium secalis]|uniref:Related to sexual differentiation process protein isp4 n=1 Tax=Rhynchosporium secalis TaxID=38038 RepID=A0A1E1MNE9_RHYSE|nr:related to sexual differentiation process protein isp4 [Rhynchosporium secalis]
MSTNEVVQKAPSLYHSSSDEKKVPKLATQTVASVDEISVERYEKELNVTGEDLLKAQEDAKNLDLEQTREIMIKVMKIHQKDPNFPIEVVERIQEFLGNSDVFENPEKHAHLIQEMKTEAALITGNSPYAEVRAVVDNTDDPSMPSSTIRAWGIGLFFVVALSFINQLFSIRQPSISVGSNVAQLLSYPIGRAAATWLPDIGFTLFGVRHSLNPGKFSRKEHMLITIMANVGSSTPYTDNIIWTQVLPLYFNQSYARGFAYQILISLGTNFSGYGIAGICRRFLVFPSYCVWPASLVTIALNSTFHTEKNEPVVSPFFKKIFTMSRLKFFAWTFAAMFVWFWFPDYIFTALSAFSWITWIAPNNVNLTTITGFNTGLGLNPFPTFDWNVLLFDAQDPFMVPFFSTLNKFLGMFIFMFVILGLYYTNTYNTSYLPINTNRVWDRFGERYNVSRAIDARGIFDPTKYEAYSPAYLGAGNLVIYLAFFGIYAAAISYAYLYHGHEIKMGFQNLYKSIRRQKSDNQEEYVDIHNKLMSKYPEVSEWWYFATLVTAIAVACAGIAGWETYTSVGVVFYGIFLCLIFVVPIGIITAMTGVEVTLNVLAEFIGGSFVAGNALAMNYFKCFGYVTCANAIAFTNDLKLAHYVKIPPRHTFCAQLAATFVSTFVCIGVLNFQINQIKDVCTPDQVNKFTCPGINTFFTAAVLWGTLGPHKMFGKNGQYSALLVGFPIGLAVPIIIYYAQKKFPKQNWLRQIHPVVMFYGALTWAPYNLSYVWPAVPLGWFSMVYMKRKYLDFWSKYNYILSASWSTAIAICGVVIFFALQWSEVELDWWGNNVVSQGCEGSPCTRFVLDEGAHFGPGIGQFH